MLNLSLARRFQKIFPTTWLWKILCDHHITIIFWQLGNLGSFIQIKLKGYYNNTINVRIFLDGFGSKIRKVNRCRSAVSNETILATKQEFFFTEVASVQSITDIVLLGFWLILLPGMFISSYTTIYFFVKNFFSNGYISVYTIIECSYLSFGWEIGHPLSMYVTRGIEGGQPKCVQVCTGGEGYHASCVRNLFSCFCLMVSCFICGNLTLHSFKMGVCQKSYFYTRRSISVVMK